MPNTPDHPQDRVERPALPSSPSSPQKPEKPKPKIQTVSNLPESIIRQGKYVVRDGKRILVLPPHVMAQYKEQLAREQQQQESVLLSPTAADPKLLSPTAADPKLLSPTTAAETDKFELTDDYIQQTIKEALAAGNLTPELEEKLMNQLQDDGAAAKQLKKGRRGGGKAGGRKPVYDPISGERMDEEWQPESSWQRNRLQKKTTTSTPEPPPFEPPSAAPTRVKAKIRGGTFASVIEERRKVSYSQNRLSSLLFKHKEQLKKDIAKKRSLLEKELSAEIMKVPYLRFMIGHDRTFMIGHDRID